MNLLGARHVLAIAISAAVPAHAADIVLTPPAAGGVSVTNAAGNATRFRVGEDGIVTLPGLGAVPVPSTGLCVEVATGRVGTCAPGGGGGGGTVTSITAGTGLTGGTITGAGTISIAPAGVSATELGTNAVVTAKIADANVTTAKIADGSVTAAKLGPNGCLNRQVLQYNGAAWACATPGHLGNSNTAVGNNAMPSTQVGFFSTAIGQGAMQAYVGGNGVGHNTAVGFVAFASAVTGQSNTMVGSRAGFAATGGNDNTAVGGRALHENQGSRNIALGRSAGQLLTSGSDNIAIGHEGVAAESDTIRIGTSGNQTRAFIAGIRGVTTGSADVVPVVIDSNGQLGTASARQSGEANVGSNPAGVNVRTITFPVAFSSVPKVVVTPKLDLFGGAEVNDSFSVTVRAVSTTQFKVNIYRVDTAGGGSSVNMRLAWTAWE